MPTLLIATTNPGKLKEFERIFAHVHDLRVVSPNDLEVWVEVAETGTTLKENAQLKSHALDNNLPPELRDLRDVWILGDDSGLEVDAMDGGPGVYSNRWAGPGTTAAQRNEALLKRLEGVPDDERAARFKCVISLIDPHGKEYILEGAVEGQIAHDVKGNNGFGYDPLFILADGRRLAELSDDEKNQISHRGAAGVQAAAIMAG